MVLKIKCMVIRSTHYLTALVLNIAVQRNVLSPENSLKSLFLNSQILWTLSTNISSLGEHLTTTCSFGRPCIIWAPLVRVSVDTSHQLLAITYAVNMLADILVDTQSTCRLTIRWHVSRPLGRQSSNIYGYRYMYIQQVSRVGRISLHYVWYLCIK